MQKEAVEGLGTGSFVTVTNLVPHACGYRKISPGKFFLITYSLTDITSSYNK